MLNKRIRIKEDEKMSVTSGFTRDRINHPCREFHCEKRNPQNRRGKINHDYTSKTATEMRVVRGRFTWE